ncbi:MAG: SRPBCC domain-containing protein [Solirubrobacteraceae bacterium]
MNLDVALDEFLPHPIEDVWQRLTDVQAISEWLMAAPGFRAEVGVQFRLKTQHLSPSGWIEARVLELDPPRRMVWAWAPEPDTAPTTVTFDLAPVAGGTRLLLTHRGEIDPAIADRLSDGWPGRLTLLRRGLDEPA